MESPVLRLCTRGPLTSVSETVTSRTRKQQEWARREQRGCERKRAVLRRAEVKVATWNVNSIRARLDHACDWLERMQPDVLCMQETKVTDDDFPTDEFMRLGYAVATIAGVRIFSVYVPNGKTTSSPSFPEKLAWLERLRVTLDETTNPNHDVLVCGDFNIATDDRDVYAPELFRGKVHFHPDEHRALARLRDFGLKDAFREHHEEGGQYSW